MEQKLVFNLEGGASPSGLTLTGMPDLDQLGLIAQLSQAHSAKRFVDMLDEFKMLVIEELNNRQSKAPES